MTFEADGLHVGSMGFLAQFNGHHLWRDGMGGKVANFHTFDARTRISRWKPSFLYLSFEVLISGTC